MKHAGSETLSSESVVLEGVPWETYEGILEAIGHYHLRHTCDRGALEMRRVIEGMAREDYMRFLEATPGLFLRHTYDKGTLEMMSPRQEHDWLGQLVARMIKAFALAVDLPIKSIGSTTIRAAKGGRGLQPDQTYYLAHEPQVRCKDTYDPKKDPPPDLAIEIDVANTSVPRLPVVARIGVREVWRLDEQRELRFFGLAKAKYEAMEQSIAFPFLKPPDPMRFINRRSEIGENGVVREFVAWATKAQRKSKS
jgi:Uma2 family endonuclease